MSERRALVWAVVILAAIAIYLAGVLVTGKFTQGGAMLLVIVAMFAFVVDAVHELLQSAFRDKQAKGRK